MTDKMREGYFKLQVDEAKEDIRLLGGVRPDEQIQHAKQREAALEEAKALVAELVGAVKAAKEMSQWFMEHSRQADHAHSELGEPLEKTAGWKELIDAGYNGLMASYQGQFEQALAALPAEYRNEDV